MGALWERWALWVEPTSPLPDRTREPRPLLALETPPPCAVGTDPGTCTPHSHQQNPTPPSGRKRRVSVYPEGPSVHPCHGSLHYRIADPPATQDTNKERRVSLQGESFRFNLKSCEGARLRPDFSGFSICCLRVRSAGAAAHVAFPGVLMHYVSTFI